MNGRTVEERAATLIRLAEDPRFAGQRWTWETIGEALGLTIAQSQAVVRWIRRNASEIYWTVGTYSTDYQHMPTSSTFDAWPGLLNQLKHEKTRVESAYHAWDVLSRIEPDPRFARVARTMARSYQRRLEDIDDQVQMLIDVFDGGDGTLTPVNA